MAFAGMSTCENGWPPVVSSKFGRSNVFGMSKFANGLMKIVG